MIIDMKRGNVLDTDMVTIVFGLNTTGWNGAGFAGQAVELCGGWPEINSGEPLALGSVHTHDQLHEGTVRRLVGIVTHDPDEGWVPQTITDGLDALCDDGIGRAAVTLMGAGLIGQMSGADPYENMAAMARSRIEVVVFTL